MVYEKKKRWWEYYHREKFNSYSGFITFEFEASFEEQSNKKADKKTDEYQFYSKHIAISFAIGKILMMRLYDWKTKSKKHSRLAYSWKV